MHTHARDVLASGDTRIGAAIGQISGWSPATSLHAPLTATCEGIPQQRPGRQMHVRTGLVKDAVIT